MDNGPFLDDLAIKKDHLPEGNVCVNGMKHSNH